MLNLEAKDDPPQFDNTPNFAGGLASYPPRHQLQPAQFYRGINTMLSNNGVVQTRRGHTFIGNAPSVGTCYSLQYLETASIKKLLGFWTGSPTVAKQYDGTSWSNAAGWTPTVGYNICTVQGIDKLYLTNWVENVRSWDGTNFVDLGNAATDAPRCKYLVWGTNRLIAAHLASANDTVAFSDILDPSSTHWSAANRIRVGAGDGNPITGIAMFSKTILAVFKRRKIYLVNIDPAVSVSQFTIDEVPGTIGCVEHRTIVTVGRDLYFLADDGLRSLSRVLQGEDAQVNLPSSQPIHDTLRFLQPLSGSYEEEYARACYFRGRIFFTSHAQTVTTLDGNYGDAHALAVFNVVLGCWEGRWTSVPRAMTVTQFGNRAQLMMAMGSSVMYWRHEDGQSDTADDVQDDDWRGADQAIESLFLTRGHTFGSEYNDKQGLAVEIDFAEVQWAARAVSVRVRLFTDDNAAVTLADALSPVGKQVITLMHQPPGRHHAVEIYAAGGKFAVKSVRFSAFINSMPVGT